MRRILVENARRKNRLKHGGQLQRVTLDNLDPAATEFNELLLLDEALTRLAGIRPEAEALVKLRFFGGHGIDEAAELIGVSPRTAGRLWLFAQAWLRREMEELACNHSPPLE